MASEHFGYSLSEEIEQGTWDSLVAADYLSYLTAELLRSGILDKQFLPRLG